MLSLLRVLTSATRACHRGKPLFFCLNGQQPLANSAPVSASRITLCQRSLRHEAQILEKVGQALAAFRGRSRRVGRQRGGGARGSNRALGVYRVGFVREAVGAAVKVWAAPRGAVRAAASSAGGSRVHSVSGPLGGGGNAKVDPARAIVSGAVLGTAGALGARVKQMRRSS